MEQHDHQDTISIEPGDIANATGQIWEALTGHTLTGADADPSTFPHNGIRAYVRLNGPSPTQHMLVTVDASPAVALTLSELAHGHTGDDHDAQDAIGELANQIAGTLKALLAWPARIEPPQPGSQQTTEPNDHTAGVGAAACAAFHIGDSALRVCVSKEPLT
jgi:hypothetical protein